MLKLLISAVFAIGMTFTAYSVPLNDHAKRADSYYSNRNFQEAVYHYSMALEIERTDAVLYFKRARAYLMIQDYENYIADLETALQLDPALPSRLSDEELVSYQIH